MEAVSEIILNRLIDKYESSKSFTGDNKVSQNFYVEPGKLFPGYLDDAEYDYFVAVNEAVEALAKKGFVRLSRLKNGIIVKVFLNIPALEAVYEELQRIPKKEDNSWLLRIWEEYEEEGENPLADYILAQKERLVKNLPVEFYDNSRKDYEDLLRGVKQVLRNNQEVYIRDFSAAVFSDSKRMEELKGKVQSLLSHYGNYESREHVLEECGVVSTPTYVALKGNGVLILGGQRLDLSKLRGDISLSTESIKELSQVQVLGQRVVTVENMTSFHAYGEKEDFVLYLGGFHNRVKREMLQSIHGWNPSKTYWHFGDIDAGGFYILEHLIRKTGIPFRSLHMDIRTLGEHREAWKPLTSNDKGRIRQLLEKFPEEGKGETGRDYREVLTYMLLHNCKLEQEAVQISAIWL